MGMPVFHNPPEGRMPRLATFLLFLLALTMGLEGEAAALTTSSNGAWTIVEPTELPSPSAPGSIPWVRPSAFAAVILDTSLLDRILTRAPLEFTPEAAIGPLVFSIPTPDGGFESFAVVESPVVHPELALWMASQGWPMRTYKGTSLDEPATTARLDWGGPGGFHAMVLSPEGSYYVDPYWQGDLRSYVSYYKRDYPPLDKGFLCQGPEGPYTAERPGGGPSTGGNLRTYRLAVAATGEYTAFHGGTAPAGQAGITTTVNRVNQVYERDLSVRMVLIPNNQVLVYTNPATDPYTNNDGGAMLGQNQTTLDSVIGDANYDIGHVVSTGGGGVAYLGVVCWSGWKARGVTGSSSPMGDPFDIDYVAHEMGHQWGGDHTFNSTLSSCGGGNREASTAYEPGSGSTIMAYAGICGADDLQPNSDDDFHGASLDQMLTYVAGWGACSVDIPASNANAPTVDAGAGHTIPVQTPFELTVAASGDLDGDFLTYDWEEFDLGPAATLAAGDNGSSPIFRSWLPSTSPTRVFPRLTDLLGGTTSPGETLPTTTRTLAFRVTARDNNPAAGRVGDDSVTLTTAASAGPFLVASPNGGETGKGTETVTWNVAGTNAGTVNAPSVDIFLSTDGGLTFPTTLASGAANDGSQAVILGSLSSSTGRIKVKGSGNVFFDVSDADFTVEPALAGFADYNADHRDEIGVFRNGMWFLTYSPDHSGVDQTSAFGSPVPGRDSPDVGEFGCVPSGGGLPDGVNDLVVFRALFSTWQATLSPGWTSAPNLSVTFGTTAHKRLSTRRMDTNGDGCSDLGVFRNGCFDVRESPGYATVGKHVCFGIGGDEPLAADLNGDHVSDLILWRGATSHFTYRLSPGYGSDNGADLGAGEAALLADMNGDGIADLGSYKAATSTFRFSYSPDFVGTDLTKTHGVSGDLPIVADVNGDGIGDIGVFRDAIARWWFLCSPGWTSTCVSQSFGTAGDIPIYGTPPGMP